MYSIEASLPLFVSLRLLLPPLELRLIRHRRSRGNVESSRGGVLHALEPCTRVHEDAPARFRGGRFGEQQSFALPVDLKIPH